MRHFLTFSNHCETLDMVLYLSQKIFEPWLSFGSWIASHILLTNGFHLLSCQTETLRQKRHQKVSLAVILRSIMRIILVQHTLWQNSLFSPKSPDRKNKQGSFNFYSKLTFWSKIRILPQCVTYQKSSFYLILSRSRISRSRSSEKRKENIKNSDCCSKGLPLQ